MGSAGHGGWSYEGHVYFHRCRFLRSNILTCVVIAVVPTPEQTYQAMSPDLRKKVDAARAARLAQESAVREQQTVQVRTTLITIWAWADPLYHV